MKLINAFVFMVIFNILYEFNGISGGSMMTDMITLLDLPFDTASKSLWGPLTELVSIATDFLDILDKANNQAEQLRQLDKRIMGMNAILYQIGEINRAIDDFISSFSDTLSYELNIQDFTIIITDIETLYYRMIEHMIEEFDSTDFVNMIVDHSTDSPRSLINILYAYVSHGPDVIGNLNLLDPLMKMIIDPDAETAKRGEMKKNALMATYLMAEGQVTALLFYAYTQLGRSQYIEELRQIVKAMFSRIATVTNKTLDSSEWYKGNTDYSFWTNDHESLGEENRNNYIEIVGLERVILFQSADFDGNELCEFPCENYSTPISPKCETAKFCTSDLPKCKGKIAECAYVQTPLMECHEPSQRTGLNIYRYLKLNDTEIEFGSQTWNAETGKVHHCYGKIIDDTHKGSGICLCKCLDEPDDDATYSITKKIRQLRRFNMMEVVTDADNGKVLTGARFVKQDQMIYIQIRESIMLSLTSINESSHQWKPIKSYDYKTQTANQEYFEFSYEDRTIALDFLNTTRNGVITGIRFFKVGHILVPEIRYHEYSEAENKLVNETWINAQNDSVSRVSIEVSNATLPFDPPFNIYSPVMLMRSRHYEAVSFRISCIIRDVSQTVVPFFDAMNVTAEPAVPINSFGLYYKSFANQAGYIGIKLGTNDIINFLMKDD